LPIFAELFLEEAYGMNITYFQVTGTSLRPSDYCYGSRLRNYRKLWFQAICDSSEHLCSNKFFM